MLGEMARTSIKRCRRLYGRHKGPYRADVLRIQQAVMTEDVNWSKASEGVKFDEKEEIRAYWTRQWGEFNPHVEPLAITEGDGGKVRVRVHQLAKGFKERFYRTAKFSTYSL